MKPRITPAARQDLRDIGDYIAQDNRAAARQTVETVVHGSRDIDAIF